MELETLALALALALTLQAMGFALRESLVNATIKKALIMFSINLVLATVCVILAVRIMEVITICTTI